MKLRFALRSPLIFNFQFLIMNDPVVQLCQLGIVPAVGCPHQVAGDALQLVDMLAAALRAAYPIHFIHCSTLLSGSPPACASGSVRSALLPYKSSVRSR